jgi:hypothetical protein
MLDQREGQVLGDGGGQSPGAVDLELVQRVAELVDL